METQYLATIKNKKPDRFSQGEPATSFPVQETGTDMVAPADRDAVSLGFRLGNLGFLLTVDIYCEVIQHPQVSPLPRVEPWFNGLLNLRGNVIPVIDLLLFLDGTASPHGKRQLLAIDRGEKTIAIWIDGYPEIVSGFPAQPAALPHLPELLQRHITGAVLHNNQVWLTIKLGELFKTLDKKNR